MGEPLSSRLLFLSSANKWGQRSELASQVHAYFPDSRTYNNGRCRRYRNRRVSSYGVVQGGRAPNIVAGRPDDWGIGSCLCQQLPGHRGDSGEIPTELSSEKWKFKQAVWIICLFPIYSQLTVCIMLRPYFTQTHRGNLIHTINPDDSITCPRQSLTPSPFFTPVKSIQTTDASECLLNTVKCSFIRLLTRFK